MLPIFDANGVPVSHMVWLKGEELRRECEVNDLVRDASFSNPGWLERTLMRLGRFLVKSGQGLYDEYTVARPQFQITSAKYAQ